MLRNPSPPGDSQNDPPSTVDKIGDSVYSKKWLSTLLLDVIQLCNKNTDYVGDIAELDSQLEQQLCCLWDLTIDSEILAHLEEFDLINILGHMVSCRRYPRLSEIGIGILANLAVDGKLCHKMSENDELINRIIALFYCRDVPTLNEVCRLVQTVLTSEEDTCVWLDAIRYLPDFLDNSLFILTSSTNSTLLTSTMRLLNVLTSIDDSLAEVWFSSQLIDALLVAQRQLTSTGDSDFVTMHRLLYTCSSYVNGVAALIDSFTQLLPSFADFLVKMCEDDPHLIALHVNHNSLRAIIPVMDVVIANVACTQALSFFESESASIPKNLISILVACKVQLDEFPLAHGIMTDIGVFFKDLVKATHQYLQQSPESSSRPALNWLVDLEEEVSTKSNGLSIKRTAFLSTCCNSSSLDSDKQEAEETRTHLIFICNHIKLPKLLECLTDD